MRTVNYGFSSLSDAALEVEAQAICLAMRNNPNFPEKSPELDAAEAASAAFATSLSRAKTGSRADIAFKNARRAELILALVRLGAFVMSHAAGNEAVLVSSGFPLKRDRQPLPPIGPVEVVSLTDGQAPGELELSIRRVAGARMYEYQYTADPLSAGSEWKGESSTLRRHTFKGLPAGKRIWCRVIAMGINGQVVYSDPVSRIAQ